MSDKELFEIMKTQMGMDPENCDPVTLDLFRQKFLGKDSSNMKKEKLEEKKRKSKQNNKIDKLDNEDKVALEYVNNENEIHFKSLKSK